MRISIFTITVLKHATPQIPHFAFGHCKHFAHKVVHLCTSADEFLIITIQTFNAVCCITAERDTVLSFETGPTGINGQPVFRVILLRLEGKLVFMMHTFARGPRLIDRLPHLWNFLYVFAYKHFLKYFEAKLGHRPKA